MTTNSQAVPHPVRIWLMHALRLAVTLGLFALIFYKVDMRAVGTVLAGLNPLWLVPALLVQITSALIAAYRWHLIMHALAFGGSLGFYAKSYLKGSFFNQALPTSIGGDALRVLEAAPLGGGKREAFYGVFIDRIVGLLGLLLLNVIANVLSPGLLPATMYWVINALAGAGLAGVVVLASLKHWQWLDSNHLTRLFYHLSNRFRTVYHNLGTALAQLGLSLVIHLLAMLTFYFTGLAIGIDYPLFIYLVVVPPVILLTLIPISLAGWGVREGGMIQLFALVNPALVGGMLAERATVLSMSLIYGLVLIAASLPGMLFFLATRRRHH